jgi:ribonuclease HI
MRTLDFTRAPHMTRGTSPCGPIHTAFCHGSCRPNPGVAGVGGVLLNPDGSERWRGGLHLGETFRISDVVVSRATSQTAELAAMLYLLKHIPRPIAVEVHTESRYVAGLVNDGWVAREHRELVQMVRDALFFRRMRVLWVPEGQRLPGHEAARSLARLHLDADVGSVGREVSP